MTNKKLPCSHGIVKIFVLAVLLSVPTISAGIDPFEFFRPSVTVTSEDRRQLDQGQSIARIVPSEDRELAVFASVRVDIDGDRLVAWMRRVELLKKSAYVLTIGRFSSPPRIEDLADLALDDEELSDVRSCRPGSCGLKLSSGEMNQLRGAAAAAGDGWKPALQRAFRTVVLERVNAYLEKGHGAVPPYDNDSVQVRPAEHFAAVLAHSTFLTTRLPAFVEGLRDYPKTTQPGVESFVYWSKERLAGKSILSARHVNILRGGEPGVPDVLVVARQLFATHYVNAELGVTALVEDRAAGRRYLVYFNRSEADALGGFFGGLVRWFAERRVRAEAADVLDGLRQRLERGNPPQATPVFDAR